MTHILDGSALAATIRAEVQAQTAAARAGGQREPGLAAVLVGEDPASKVYVRNKTRDCLEVGIDGRTIRLPETIGEAELVALVDRLNADPAVDGILVQVPLPRAIDPARIQARVRPDKDVDGFHPENTGRLWLDRPAFVPCTPLGIIELLRRHQLSIAGRHAVVVGRSAIVGKPMAALLLREHCTVTVCHSRTADLPAICRSADILVAAIGRPGMIGRDHVREGAVVIDVGINRVTDRATLERLLPADSPRWAAFAKSGGLTVGDVDFEQVRERTAAITPVPGGVGPLTRALLLVNTLAAFRAHTGPH